MPARALKFDISDEVLALGVRGTYFVLEELRNREIDEDLDRLRIETVQTTLREAIDPKQDPVLKGFRDLHESVSCSNRKFVASPENLITMVLSTGRLPRVNVLVDVYNIVSLKTRLALGAHDIDRIDGDVHLRRTRGDERFVPLGSEVPKAIRFGEYGYVDDANEVICRLEVRQVEKTKVDIDSRHCFFIVQGNKATDVEYLQRSTHTLIELLTQYCGGTVRMLYEWR